MKPWGANKSVQVWRGQAGFSSLVQQECTFIFVLAVWLFHTSVIKNLVLRLSRLAKHAQSKYSYMSLEAPPGAGRNLASKTLYCTPTDCCSRSVYDGLLHVDLPLVISYKTSPSAALRSVKSSLKHSVAQARFPWQWAQSGWSLFTIQNNNQQCPVILLNVSLSV